MPTYYGDSFANSVTQSKVGNYATFYTYEGNDIVFLNVLGSSRGYNYVYAGSGNDKIYSNGYNNTIVGGTGYDLVDYSSYGSANGMKISLVNNYGQIYGTTWKDTFSSIESVVGTNAADDIYGNSEGNSLWGAGGSDMISAGGGNDKVYGGSNNDFLYGAAGNDDIYGGTNNDKLWGNEGDDDLYGESGNDWLQGGAGSDFLWGGSGADRFVFAARSDTLPSTRDFIYDFSSFEGDMIDLSLIDANTNFSGNQAFTALRSSFSGRAGELKYSGGILSGDVNGDAVADFQITIKNGATLHLGDFYL